MKWIVKKIWITINLIYMNFIFKYINEGEFKSKIK